MNLFSSIFDFPSLRSSSNFCQSNIYEHIALKKLLPYLVVAALVLVAISCNKKGGGNSEADLKSPEITSLKVSLDSIDILCQDPASIKIASRVYEKVKANEGSPLRIRTLRAVSTALLSKSFPTRAQLDSAVSFAHESADLALAENDSIEWALNQIQIGRYHYLRSYWLSEYDGSARASDAFLPAIHFLEKRNVNEGVSFAYYWLASSMRKGKDYLIKVLDYKLRALHYNDSAKFPVLRAKICNSLAVTYNDYTNDLNKGKPYLLRAKAILEKSTDRFTLSIVLGNLGNVFERQGNIDQSLYYYRAAANVAHAAELWQREADAHHQITKLYQYLGKYDSAMVYHQKTIKTIKKKDTYSPDVVNRWKIEVAKSYIETGHRDIALQLVKALEESLAHKTAEAAELNDISESLEHLIAMYQVLGDYKNLSIAQGRMIQFRDTLYARDQMVEVGRVESAYEIKLKDKELKVLQLSVELQAEEAKVARYILALLGVVVLITTIGLILVLRLLKQKNKLYKALGERNETIEKQRQELERSLNDLQRAQAHMLTTEKMVMLGQFTAGVAHELNNPLNFVSGGVSVLDDVIRNSFLKEGTTKEEMEEVSADLHSVLRNINNGVDRMTSIVESLQIFSNPREELTDNSESDLADCLDASLLLIKSKLQVDKIRVTKSYAPIKVRGHSGRISQVFINLIDNAIHALLSTGEKERHLTISTTTTDDYVHVNFEDNGVGIPNDIKSDIFNAFFTTKETGQGTGLGLFICYNIIKELNGKITFTSEVGRGTTFTVTLLRSKF